MCSFAWQDGISTCRPFVYVTSKAGRPSMKRVCRSAGNNKKKKKKEDERKTFFSSVSFSLHN